MVRNVVLPVSLVQLMGKCTAGSLLNLDVFMCRALLALNVVQMLTYSSASVCYRLFECMC